MRPAGHLALVLGVAATLAAIDVASKVAAIAGEPDRVLYDPRSQVLLFAVAACVALVTLVPRAGSVALDVAAGVLVGGCLGNLASLLLWPSGIPDFVRGGQIVFNLADVFIWIGIVALLAVAAVLGVSHRRATR